MAISEPRWVCNRRKESIFIIFNEKSNRQMKGCIDQEKFKEVLIYAYTIGNEVEDMKLSSLIEEIKKRLDEIDSNK